MKCIVRVKRSPLEDKNGCFREIKELSHLLLFVKYGGGLLASIMVIS